MDRGFVEIMRNGVLLPGIAMPKLGPPPPDPHPNPQVQRMRESWDLRFICWEGVWGHHRPHAERSNGYRMGGSPA